MSSILEVIQNEAARREAFPVCKNKIFTGHAGVTVLPRAVAEAMNGYQTRSCENHQEFGEVLRDVKDARRLCADLIGATPQEIALLGPTSLGLSLVANGIPWNPGDEIICYAGDYPANVYPWLEQHRKGVVIRLLEPETPGRITPELVQAAITPRTRLVALASANFLTGHRLDIDSVGALCRKAGVLFCLDAIQTLGAFPVSVANVDFLSADAHKWLLGPLAIGVVYVRKECFDLVRPTLIGAWNVVSPNFIAQPEIEFVPTAQRYEPGVLNIAGIYGMSAAIRLIQEAGIETVAGRIRENCVFLRHRLEPAGFEFIGPTQEAEMSGILTFRHPTVSGSRLFQGLEAAGIVASLRHNREGVELIRVSPHFYNTTTEMERIATTLIDTISTVS